ncbi:MAG: PD-(D/E)XK nuclease family protein, partial [Erysipelotrichaceae bacterium]|nr:PD-(D/E)XK nuclease family protein [Erysipelotrichaceae bacterium]
HTSMIDKTHLDSLLERAGQYPNQSEVLHFVHDQQRDLENDSENEAFPYGKDADVVRIKTMHQSKGLQFPVIYLLGYKRSMSNKYPVLMDADLGMGWMTLNAPRTVKRPGKDYLAVQMKQHFDEIYEEMRVFYVATTRAQQECVYVDSIKDMEEYQCPLDLRHFIPAVNYTDWLLHTYHGQSNSLIRFQRHPLYERPKTPEPVEKKVSFKTYQGKRNVSETVTASALKQKQQWKPLDLSGADATKRGTLFHEIMGQCAYPYQEEEMRALAKSYGMDLSRTDLDQLKAINANEQYAQWMKEEHVFELSYLIEKDQSIIHGFMDLVVRLPHKTVIVDYKTDHVDSKEELIEKYKIQLDTYKEAYQHIDASKPIETFLYSFHLKEMIAL